MPHAARAALVFAPLLGLLFAPAASAHISANPGEAPAGATVPVAFRVGHGCAGAATTQLRIEIPAEVLSARPRPKPGWTLTLDYDGKAAGARVTAVTWRGLLPDTQFDEFEILMKLPSAEGPAYFPAVQTCGRTVEQWTERPSSPSETLTHPAPVVVIGSPAKDPAAAAMAAMPGM